jgi:hypothetical protein
MLYLSLAIGVTAVTHGHGRESISYGIKNVKHDETAGNLDNIDFSEFFIKF